MRLKIISASCAWALALLLAACETEPIRPTAGDDEPIAAETPAAGSQAEADAAAAEAAEAVTEIPERPAAEEAVDTAPPEPVAKPKQESRPAGGPPATHASASAVLPPVWIYRGTLSTALLAGTAIYEGDRIETGADGRAQFSFDDNGTLQLGGNTQMTVTRLRPNATASLDGALDVSRGTFAFESGRTGTLLPGDLDFKLGKLSAGISQAALMGRNSGASSLVCLLGGSAAVAMSNQPPVTLDKSNACVSSAKTALANAGTAQQVASLQQDTRPPAGIKATKFDGTWSLVFVSASNEAAAKKEALRLWKAGYPAEVVESKVKGKLAYRVALRGFESREAANAFKPRAAGLGYKNSWASGK